MEYLMRTKKQAYTHHILYDMFCSGGGRRDYLSLPRKLKKRIKRRVENLRYYDRKRKLVCIFHPKILSFPVHKEIINIYKNLRPQSRVSAPIRFHRYANE